MPTMATFGKPAMAAMIPTQVCRIVPALSRVVSDMKIAFAVDETSSSGGDSEDAASIEPVDGV